MVPTFAGTVERSENLYASIVTTIDIYGHLFEEGAVHRKAKVQQIEREILGKAKKVGEEPK